MKFALALLVSSTLVLAGCESNKPEPIPTFLVPEEYATIQEAIDAATPGSSVLIEPGVYTAATRRFPDTPEFPNGIYAALHLKDGVNVIGHSEDSPIIVRNLAPPESLAYGAILFNSTSASIQNIVFEDFYTGVVILGDGGTVVGCEITGSEAGIWSFRTDDEEGNFNNRPNIRYNYVADIRVDGILVQYSSPIVEGNLVTQCGGGIGVEFPGKPLVYGNVLCFNKAGMVTNGGAEPTLVLNAFLNNSVTAVATMTGALPSVSRTDFYGNEKSVLVFQYDPPLEEPLAFEDNYWYSVIEEDILEGIEDARIDSAKGAVIGISPFRREPVNLGAYNPSGIDLITFCEENQPDLRAVWRALKANRPF